MTWTVNPTGPLVGLRVNDGILNVVVVLEVWVLNFVVRLVVVDVTVVESVLVELVVCSGEAKPTNRFRSVGL